MRRLLSANFFSMLHTKRLWLGAIFMALMAGVQIITVRVDAARGFSDQVIDGSILSFAPLVFILLPIVCGLYINADYQDGTIRNKITVGRTRTSVYLSNLLIVWLAEIFYTAVHVAVALIGGVGMEFGDPEGLLVKAGLLLLTIAALAAIAVFMASLITGRHALVLCALIAVAMMFGSQIINQLLETPDQMSDISDITYISAGDGMMIPHFTDSEGNFYDNVEDIPTIPNPNYIREPLRGIMRTYNNVSPGGQMWEIIQGGHQEWDVEAQTGVTLETPYWQLAVYSLCVIAVFTLLGLILFGKKDLK